MRGHLPISLALATVVLAPRPAAAQFTISLEPGDGGAGKLALTWADTRVWVPVQPKP